MGVRWDAVVDCGATDFASPRAHPVAAAPADRRTQVRIQLFGVLAARSPEPTVQLEIDASATLGDLLALVAERLGEWFLDCVRDESGHKRRHCRIFVGGYPIEDLQTPLRAAADPSEVEIILLIAPEGG